jgi:uncharacterized RDD family membrane protein YckC
MLGWTRAPLGRRVGAFLIDLGLVGVAPVVVIAVLSAVATPAATVDDPNPGPPAWIALLYGTWLALILWWFVWGEGRREGQTVGKQWLGVRVVRGRDGEPLGYGHAFGRTIARYVSAFFCGLGYFWALWDPQNQAFHDKIANTYVIDARVSRYTHGQPTPPDLNKTSQGDMVVGASGILLLVFSFLPWYGKFGGSRNGWDYFLFGVIPVILGIVMVAVVVVRNFTETRTPPPVGYGQLHVILGAVAFALVLLRLLITDKVGALGVHVSLDRKYGLFLAVLASLGLLAGGLLKMREAQAAGPATPGFGGTGV